MQFEAEVINATPPLSYQWRRNGVDITGATGPTYTLGGAQLGDDGARFTVTVSAANGVSTGGMVLLVSPLPGVVFQDADFPVSNWTVTATAQPAQNGPTHTESQATDGGNPGAYRSITYQMTPGPSSLRLDHFAVAATLRPGHAGSDLHDRPRGRMQPAELLQRIDVHRADACRRCSSRPVGHTSRAMWHRVLPSFEHWIGMRVSSLKADEFVVLGAGRAAPTRSAPTFRRPRRPFASASSRTWASPPAHPPASGRAGHRQLEGDGLEALTADAPPPRRRGAAAAMPCARHG